MIDQGVKSFDCVASMREIRDVISKEIENMNAEERLHYYNERNYEDPILQKFAAELRPSRFAQEKAHS